MSDGKVEFEGIKCTGETEKAILVKIEGTRHWIPKNQVDDDSDVYKTGTDGTLIISEWIAKEKGLV